MGNILVISPTTRRFLVFLSACGLAASTLAYIKSFSEDSIDHSMRLALPLLIGVLALEIPIHILESSSSSHRRFYWKEIVRGMPRWVVPSSYLLVLAVIVHGVLFFLQGGSGVPTLHDGQYILNGHGRILKVLTQEEYLTLRRAELRMLASLMMCWYYMPMMYWWFRRNAQRVD